MNENGLLRPQWFIFPDEVDQVLRWVDELGVLGSKPAVELGSLGVRHHASVNADSGILGVVDKPFYPVLGAVYVTGFEAIPV